MTTKTSDKIKVTGPYMIADGKWRVGVREGDCVQHFTFPNPVHGHQMAIDKANELHEIARRNT